MIAARSILVPLDFSPHSLKALDYAIALARASKASLSLLFVSDPGAPVSEYREYTSPEHLMNLLERDGRLDLVRHDSEVLEGPVVDVILAQQNRRKADLIVMGTLGAGTAARRWFGTRTTAVISRAECPVLAVPAAAAYGPIRKVAVATDLSGGDLEVIQEATALVRPVGPELMFLFVDTTSRGRKETVYRMKEVSPQISKYIDYSPMSFYVSTHRNLYGGLEAFSSKQKADLLMMVTHTRHFASAFLHPSKTQQVARTAAVPLLAVPLR